MERLNRSLPINWALIYFRFMRLIRDGMDCNQNSSLVKCRKLNRNTKFLAWISFVVAILVFFYRFSHNDHRPCNVLAQFRSGEFQMRVCPFDFIERLRVRLFKWKNRYFRTDTSPHHKIQHMHKSFKNFSVYVWSQLSIF